MTATQTIALQNAMIIDGTGADPISNGTVIIEGDRIREIFHCGPGRLPSDAHVIDCGQRTLLPGLIDAHVYIGAVSADIAEQQRRYFPSTVTI